MRKPRLISFVLATMLLFASCTSVTTSKLNERALNDVTSYVAPSIDNLEFKWSSIVVEKTVTLDYGLKMRSPLFLGYNDSNVYIADWGDDEFICYRYPLSGDVPTSMWKNNPNTIILGSVYMGDGLRIVGFSTEDGKVMTNLWTVRDDGTHSVMPLCEGYAEVSIFDNRVFIFSEESIDGVVKTHISLYNMDSHQIQPIVSKTCKQNEDGTLLGDRLLYVGGCGGTNNQILYYQVVSLENESLDTGGNTVLYYYSLADEKSYELLSLDRKLIFLSGNDEFFLSSEYYFNPPFLPSGRIHTFDSINSVEWGGYQIPGVQAGADIYNCFYLNDGIISFSSSNSLYFADVRNKTMQAFNFEEVQQRASHYGESLGYADFAKDKIVLHLFTRG